MDSLTFEEVQPNRLWLWTANATMDRLVDDESAQTLLVLKHLEDVGHGPRMLLAHGAAAESTGRIGGQVADPAIHA